MIKNSKKILRQLKEQYPDLSDYEIKILLIKQSLNRIDTNKNDEWLYFPLPDMVEPEKAVCRLTASSERHFNLDHLARLYNRASLRASDRFCEIIRRRLNPLESPIHTSSNVQKVWHGYSLYNPELIIKLLTILRTYYNYIPLDSKDNKTPAMRLGLAEGVVPLKDIINGRHFSDLPKIPRTKGAQ